VSAVRLEAVARVACSRSGCVIDEGVGRKKIRAANETHCSVEDMVGPEDTVTITAVSWHDSVLPRPLRFAPPYADLSTNPAGFSRFWQYAEYAFHLPDPSGFPPFAALLLDDQRRSVERFIASAKELAGYSFMSASAGVSVSVSGEIEVVSAEFGSNEAFRAAATLFRQLYGTDAGAYGEVVGILSAAHRSARDERFDEREDVIVPWRKAHGALRQQRIQAIVGRLAADAASGPGVSAPVPFEDIRPTEVISKYLNGDLIHWGDKREALAALGVDDFSRAMDRMHFVESITGLAHFYSGFSVLLARAFARSLQPR